VRLGRARASLSPRTQIRFFASLGRDVRRLRRLIKQHRPDVVVVGGYINPHAIIAANRERVPVVWEIVDSRTPRVVRALLRPLLHSRADAAMFWGQALVLPHAGSQTLECPTATCASPVDSQRFRVPDDGGREARRLLGLPPDAPVVGIVGNLNPQKGIEYFVEAAGLLERALGPLYYVVVGPRLPTHEGYARQIDQAVATSGIDASRFIFTGSRRDVEACLQAMTVKLMTSVPASEGIPTVIGEAFACGVPVVATDVGAVAEVVEDGLSGFVVPPCDAAALADRAQVLITQPEARARMSARARERALEVFDPMRCADVHIWTFEAAIAHHRRRAE
jgi:glycosyltransferase involved in cell wall biosynthesis